MVAQEPNSVGMWVLGDHGSCGSTGAHLNREVGLEVTMGTRPHGTRRGLSLVNVRVFTRSSGQLTVYMLPGY
jgi:hypothetical protein